jgi:UDP-N-acetylmuramate dehydrogenase
MVEIMNLEQLFRQHFPSFNFLFDFSLDQKSYFKIGGNAEVFYSAKNRQEAIDLLLFCKKENIRFSILGGSSNVIIADEGVKGLVLSLDFAELKIVSEAEDKLLIQADAGIKTSALVGKVAALGGGGLEGFIGVPGVLGGAIYNNAHYLKDLIGDSIEQVETFDLEKEEIVLLTREKCEFAYEQSVFQKNKNLLIFSAFFALKKSSPDEVKQKVAASIEKRSLTQPLDLPSCGCVFQNPPNDEHLKKIFPQFAEVQFVPAGFLIEQAGLKGTKEGDIQVSEKHAAFFVNLGHGKAKDVVTLIEKVKSIVLEKFNVILKEEVFYLR